MPNLYWMTTSGPAGQEVTFSSAGQGPIRQRAAALDPNDVSYPAPGGGLLRVPVGGGAAAPMQGTIAGQMVFWDAAAGQWRATTTGPGGIGGQVPTWEANAQEYVFAPAVAPRQIGYTLSGPSNVLTLAPIGHTAGLYLVSQLPNVRTTAAVGSINPTISFGCPGVGPSTLALGAQNVAVAGIQLNTARALISDGSQAITIQWAVTVVPVGAPVVDLYAPLVFTAPL